MNPLSLNPHYNSETLPPSQPTEKNEPSFGRKKIVKEDKDQGMSTTKKLALTGFFGAAGFGLWTALENLPSKTTHINPTPSIDAKPFLSQEAMLSLGVVAVSVVVTGLYLCRQKEKTIPPKPVKSPAPIIPPIKKLESKLKSQIDTNQFEGALDSILHFLLDPTKKAIEATELDIASGYLQTVSQGFQDVLQYPDHNSKPEILVPLGTLKKLNSVYELIKENSKEDSAIHKTCVKFLTNGQLQIKSFYRSNSEEANFILEKAKIHFIQCFSDLILQKKMPKPNFLVSFFTNFKWDEIKNTILNFFSAKITELPLQAMDFWNKCCVNKPDIFLPDIDGNITKLKVHLDAIQDENDQDYFFKQTIEFINNFKKSDEKRYETFFTDDLPQIALKHFKNKGLVDGAIDCFVRHVNVIKYSKKKNLNGIIDNFIIYDDALYLKYFESCLTLLIASQNFDLILERVPKSFEHSGSKAFPIACSVLEKLCILDPSTALKLLNQCHNKNWDFINSITNNELIGNLTDSVITYLDSKQERMEKEYQEVLELLVNTVNLTKKLGKLDQSKVDEFFTTQLPTFVIGESPEEFIQRVSENHEKKKAESSEKVNVILTLSRPNLPEKDPDLDEFVLLN